MDERPVSHSMGISDLKDELRTYGAKISGRKKELCDRLQFYRENKHVVSLEPEYKMTLPETSAYRDIHRGMMSSLPKLNKTRLDEYLAQFNQSFDSKIKDFHKQRYVRFLRVSEGHNSTAGIYVTSLVWAEMKKSVSYKVDILIEHTGVISETQCECGAGQGPGAHCKHVITVLYATVQFIESGEIITEVTCTQVLQTFHRTKPHKGSPLKLSLTCNDKTRSLRYDPRRHCDRKQEEYNSEVRNLCLNYQANCGGSMPVMQIFPPANLHAIVIDHDYLKYDACYKFLFDEKLISIDKVEMEKIELSTHGQNQNMEWKKARALRITASNFGRIVKGTGRQDKIKLAKNLVTSRDIKTDAVLHGIKYEAIAVRKYEDLCGKTTSQCGLFVSIDNPILAASPDRVVDHDLIVEVKCPYTARNQVISPQTVPYLIINSEGQLTLKTNHDYYYQVQGQIYCSNRSSCDFVVYTSKDVKIIRIKRDMKFIQEMVKVLTNFHSVYHKNVLISKYVYKNYYDYNF